MPLIVRETKEKTMKDRRKLASFIKYMVITVILVAIGIFGLSINVGQSIQAQTIQRFVLGAIMLIALYVLSGKEALTWKKKSTRYMLLLSAYQLLFSLLTAISTYMDGPKVVKSDWLFVLLSNLALAFCVGLYEEGFMRGIFLNGLIKILPNTKAGLWMAVIISSFLFGFIHVIWDIPYILINPLSVIIQMAAKTIVTGASGMLFAALYLKTKNIWTCVIVHAIYDFFLFLQEAFSRLGSTTPSAQYVHVHMEMTPEQIIFYLLMILRVLPNIIIAILVIRKLNPKEYVFWK